MKRLALAAVVIAAAAACGGSKSPATTPTPPADPAGDAAAAAPEGPMAPQVHTLEQLRDANPTGTTYRFRVVVTGKPETVMQMEFLATDADGAEIKQTILDAGGASLGTPEQARSPWTELHSHGAFPAASTTITDETVAVPAGTFPAKHYSVRDAEGDAVTDIFFATDPTLAGPPLRMTVTAQGKTVMSMELIERTSPR